ncbi:hypothetical protein CH362_19060 [Leptospira saintgironsiae]|uniref:Uncharacterized protein n=1 Tax=Leptospira saintgironsiae TaxID=2023183 RepID=A0A2M9Y7C4_9LEPT|nr:hypothetical protein CH362_19060 [Leptospira saintgironsiae]
MLSQPSLGLRHISLCHSSCKASLMPSPHGHAKRRQALVVRRNIAIFFYFYYISFRFYLRA